MSKPKKEKKKKSTSPRWLKTRKQLKRKLLK